MYKLEIKPSEKIHTIFGTAKIENGYYRIVSRKEKNYQKFFHRLIFEDFIRRVNLDDLKEEVLKRGLKWEKI